MAGKKLGKQSQHVRRVRTKKGAKRIVINKGYVRNVAKRRSRSMSSVPEEYRVYLGADSIYDVIGVNRFDDTDAIRKRIKFLTKYWHPDVKLTGDAEVMNKLNEIRKVFENDENRLDYMSKSGNLFDYDSALRGVKRRPTKEDFDDAKRENERVLQSLDGLNYLSEVLGEEGEVSEDKFRDQVKNIIMSGRDEDVTVTELPDVFEDSDDIKLLDYEPEKSQK